MGKRREQILFPFLPGWVLRFRMTVSNETDRTRRIELLNGETTSESIFIRRKRNGKKRSFTCWEGKGVGKEEDGENGRYPFAGRDGVTGRLSVSPLLLASPSSLYIPCFSFFPPLQPCFSLGSLTGHCGGLGKEGQRWLSHSKRWHGSCMGPWGSLSGHFGCWVLLYFLWVSLLFRLLRLFLVHTRCSTILYRGTTAVTEEGTARVSEQERDGSWFAILLVVCCLLAVAELLVVRGGGLVSLLYNSSTGPRRPGA